jgi:hypothetical protein
LPGEKRRDGTAKTASDKRTEAQDFCRALENAEKNAKAGTLTESAAKKLIAEIVERTTGEAFHQHTVTDWMAEWTTGKADSKAKTTAERYKQVSRDFLKSLGDRAKLSIGHIAPRDIRNFRAAELEAGKSPNTANDSVRIISAAFNAALRQGLIANNPCTALESLPEEIAERSIFTVDQVAELLRWHKGIGRAQFCLRTTQEPV